MSIKYLLGTLALTVSSAAVAAEPSPTPKKACCCCKMDEQGKMACCKDKAGQTGDEHKGHDMSGMNPK